MLDAIRITVDITAAEREHLLSVVADVGDESWNNSTQYNTYKHFVVSIHDTYVKIKGSLPRFLWGSNHHNIERSDLQNVQQAFQSELGIDITYGKITYMELAQSVAVDQYPSDYINRFSINDMSGHKLHMIPGQTACFRNNTRWITLYDKTNEMRDNNREPANHDKHLLRFEIKILRRLQKELDLDGPLLFHQLYSPRFYNHLINYWLQIFYKLPYTTYPEFDICRTKKELVYQLAAFGLTDLGYNNILSKMEAWRSTKIVDRQKHYSFRKALEEVVTFGSRKEKDDLLDELNLKIVALCQRQWASDDSSQQIRPCW